MATTRADSPHPAGPALQILSTLASLAVGAMFFALWFWLLPGRLGFQTYFHTIPRWRWLAAIPSILGFAVALRCIWDFGWTGRGTPAPVAPPTRLVVVGFYRYVRIPMYVGFFTGWIGLWIIFGRANTAALFVAVVAILAVVLFVRLYEEPTLRKLSAPTTPSTPKTSPAGSPASAPGTPSSPIVYHPSCNPCPSLCSARFYASRLFPAMTRLGAPISRLASNSALHPLPASSAAAPGTTCKHCPSLCSASFYASRLSPQPGPLIGAPTSRLASNSALHPPTRAFGSERSPRPHCSRGAAQ